MKNNILIIILVGAGLLISIFFVYRFTDLFSASSNNTSDAISSTPVPRRPTIYFEETDSQTPDIWLTYINTEYGFEISYPDEYILLKGADAIDWPNAIVIIAAGADSYDLPIEAWDSVSEYEDKYSNQLDDLVVKQINDKYITLINNSGTEKVDDIIATFIEL